MNVTEAGQLQRMVGDVDAEDETEQIDLDALSRASVRPSTPQSETCHPVPLAAGAKMRRGPR